MKMNSKGFTLIELLAVIVILAVIALIATPLIMGVIDDAKKGSAENTAYGFGKAVENAIATQMITDTTFAPTSPIKSNTTIAGTTTGNVAATAKIDYKGTQPTDVNLIIVNGVVSKDSTITVDGYKFKMNDKSKWVFQAS